MLFDNGKIYDDNYGHFEYLWPTGLTEILNIEGASFTYVKENEEIHLSNEILIGAHVKRFILRNTGEVKIIGIRAYNHGARLLFGIDANKFKWTISNFLLESLDKEKLFRMDNLGVVNYLDEYCKAFIKEDELLNVLYKI